MTWILVLFFVSSVLYFFSYPEADNDLWGHLLFGRTIWEEQRIPLENRFSYTAPTHPWINHEWLAELVFYGAYAVFGSPGLVLLKVIVAGGAVYVLNRNIESTVRSSAVSALALFWTMAILAPGFNVRPQIFTYLFLTITLFLLYRFEGGRKTALYGSVPLMILWVNHHGGFIVGVGAVSVFCLSHLVGQRPKHARLHVLVVLGLLLACPLVNPYGVKLVTFLWHDLTVTRPITEWQPLPLASLAGIDFKLAVFLVCWIVVKRRSWGHWETILVALTALFAFCHQRHTPLFAIAAAPFLARGIGEVSAWGNQKYSASASSLRRGFGLTVCGLVAYQLFCVGHVHWQNRFRIVVSPLDFPTQAADFLARNNIDGNLVVPFDWGEYLVWKRYPENRVSIDGRYTTAYPLATIQDSWSWMEGRNGWRRLLDRYPSEIALTNRHHPVTALMRMDPEWIYIYSDPVAFVFVRKIASQERLLARFRERKLIAPQSPPVYFPG
jgi:hypothetical protein